MPRRHGSLAFRPRKRAATQKAVFRSYPEIESSGVVLAGFPGYKAGMTHVIMVEDRPGRPTTGQEIAVPSTVVETPPVRVIGVRPYVGTPYGLKPLTTYLKFEITGEIRRSMTLGKREGVLTNEDTAARRREEGRESVREVRLIVATQPKLAALPKKKPEVLEIPLKGSTVQERLDRAMEMVGTVVRISDVFKVGQLIDVTAVTKGHGWQGVVRRFGVELLRHKAGKGRWRVGSLGSRHPPYVTWRVPRAGQTGYHKRTEYNKRVLLMGLAKYSEEGELVEEAFPDLNPPSGGFRGYGRVRSDYVLLSGSVPGPAKRFVMMRHPIRPYTRDLREPRIIYVSGVGYLEQILKARAEEEQERAQEAQAVAGGGEGG
ncbi:MAG: 50S ribosomal protein L3 [Candidatus Korarchaeota archaeon]|nr:50S ribosomal protein L3 [Candidatus Korarchaeota archaeon]